MAARTASCCPTRIDERVTINKLPDGRYRVDDRIFPDADAAIAYDGLRSAGTASFAEIPQDSAQPTDAAPPTATAARSGFSLWWLILIIPVGIFLLLMLIGTLSGPPSERQTARMAIELCWKEQSRKSLDPGSQRFIAGSCEMMEREFRAKYGANP